MMLALAVGVVMVVGVTVVHPTIQHRKSFLKLITSTADLSEVE